MKSGERSDKKAPNSNLDFKFSASSPPVESTVLIINVFLSKTIIIIVLGITV